MKTRTGWVVCEMADQTWAYLAKPEHGFGLPADEHGFTIEPREARILRATGREAAAAKATALLGRPVGHGRVVNPQPLGPGMGAPFHEDSPWPEDTEAWVEFVRDVRAFRKGPATW